MNYARVLAVLAACISGAYLVSATPISYADESASTTHPTSVTTSSVGASLLPRSGTSNTPAIPQSKYDFVNARASSSKLSNDRKAPKTFVSKQRSPDAQSDNHANWDSAYETYETYAEQQVFKYFKPRFWNYLGLGNSLPISRNTIHALVNRYRPDKNGSKKDFAAKMVGMYEESLKASRKPPSINFINPSETRYPDSFKFSFAAKPTTEETEETDLEYGIQILFNYYSQRPAVYTQFYPELFTYDTLEEYVQSYPRQGKEGLRKWAEFLIRNYATRLVEAISTPGEMPTFDTAYISRRMRSALGLEGSL